MRPLGQTLHCGRIAGTCIKDHPKEKEGGNIKHANATTQPNNLILRCLKSVVLTVTNPNCNYAKAYKRGTCSNDMCHTPIHLHYGEHIVDNKHVIIFLIIFWSILLCPHRLMVKQHIRKSATHCAYRHTIGTVGNKVREMGIVVIRGQSI